MMTERPYDKEKWIAVSFDLELPISVPEGDVKKIVTDMCSIVLNTHMVVNSKGEALGNVSSHFSNTSGGSPIFRYRIKDGKILNQAIPTYTKPKNIFSVSKEFIPHMIKDEKKYKIQIFPIREHDGKEEYDLYSLKGLDIEMGCLSGAQNLICEKYEIELKDDPCYPSYHGPVMIDNELWMEMHAGILVLKGTYGNMKLYSEKCPVLFDHVFTNAREVIEKYLTK